LAVQGTEAVAARVSGRERLLRNYIKVREVLVVIVVRGGKVDIGYMMLADAVGGSVRSLENLYSRNVKFGMSVQASSERHCLSNFFTDGVDGFSERAVRNVSNRFGTASIEEIEPSRLSTVEADVTENRDQG
jgi:hypothetical protein